MAAYATYESYAAQRGLAAVAACQIQSNTDFRVAVTALSDATGDLDVAQLNLLSARGTAADRERAAATYAQAVRDRIAARNAHPLVLRDCTGVGD